MQTTLLLVLLALAPPAVARALDPQAVAQEKAADPVGELRSQFDTLSREAGKPAFDAQKFQKDRAELVARARALMKDDPRGELAVRVRVWMATSGVESASQAALFDELLTKDIASPALAELADWLRPGEGPEQRTRLEELVDKAGDRTVRGRALWTLGDHAKRERDRVRGLEAGDIKTEAFEKEFGDERAETLRKTGVAGLEKQYVATLERVIKDYGDVPDARGRRIGTRAEGALFELRSLQIGMLVPDIEAEDIDGVAFKLSDYRGKVVVLDFWGHW